jgi:hypothetical protein
MASSPSSRPYQSRVVRYLRRQSQQWTVTCKHSLRRLKLAVTWGAEASLYPVYALVSQVLTTVQAVGRRLRPGSTMSAAIGSASSQTTADPPDLATVLEPADAPVRALLPQVAKLVPGATLAPLALDPASQGASRRKKRSLISQLRRWSPGRLAGRGWLSLRSQSDSQSDSQSEQSGALTVNEPTTLTPSRSVPSIPPAPVQGLASCLSRRRLVLVLLGNQIWDRLDLGQQQAIQQRLERLVKVQQIQAQQHSRQINPITGTPPNRFRLPFSLGQQPWVISLKQIASPPLLAPETPQPLAPDSQPWPSRVSPSNPLAHQPIAQSAEQPTSQFVDQSADWIEIPAAVIDYVEHPLTRLLHGLDRLMVWLEQLWDQVLAWLRGLRSQPSPPPDPSGNVPSASLVKPSRSGLKSSQSLGEL